MKRFRIALLGACAAALAFATTTFAGSGVGDVFNLGQTNSVNASSILTGSPSSATPMLDVRNGSGLSGSFGVVGRLTSGSSTSGSAAVRGIGSGSGAGVFGSSSGGYGVRGTSVTGIGVYGAHTATTGTGPGVRGDTSSTAVSAVGLYGLVASSSSAPSSAGVRGENKGAGAGVYGTSASGYGVYGYNIPGTAVYGLTGSGIGVKAWANGGTGVDSYSSGGAAVKAHSYSGNGVDAQSDQGIGVLGKGTGKGILGIQGSAVCANTAEFIAFAVGGCGDSWPGVVGSSASRAGVVGQATTSAATGVLGDSTSRSVEGRFNFASCQGAYAVGGCAGASDYADGVYGVSGANGAGVRAANTSGGDILVAEAPIGSPKARIDSSGEVFADGGFHTGGADYAESIRAGASGLQAGDVVAIDPTQGYAVRKSDRPYSRLVVGVYSTKPAVLAVGSHRVNDSLKGEVPVAMMGVVPTKVTAANGAIRAGDLLTTSRLAGYAMKAKPVVVHGVAIYPTGAILGKALQPLRRGTGTIEVLMMLR
jgi:hypothetical protein